jgi:hypothetical protein
MWFCNALLDSALASLRSELFTPAQGAREWLARNDCSPSLLVHPDLAQEFEDDSHRTVVAGDPGKAFYYASLNRAFGELIADAKLIALAKNRSFKDADGTRFNDADTQANNRVSAFRL